MRRPDDGQGHLFAAESLAPNLFDADSFAQRLTVIADEWFGDAQFADRYADMGRPARSPEIMQRGCQRVATVKPAPNPRGYSSRDRCTDDATTKTATGPADRTTQTSVVAADGDGLV